MALARRALVLTGFLAVALSGVGAAVAAPATVTFPLFGTRMASMAHGVATVTRTAPGDYKVVVTLTDMPVPSTLRTTPIRHAYVAWAFNAANMRAPRPGGQTSRGGARNPAAMLGTLVPIALHAISASTYTGTGTVMMTHTPGIIVTAEVSAMVHKPALPFWGVLISRATRPQG
jgi:hypothetical protein